MLLTIIVLSIVIVIVEGKPLIKKNKNKELFTIFIILLMSIFIVSEKYLGWETPIDMLNNLLYPLGKMIFKSR